MSADKRKTIIMYMREGKTASSSYYRLLQYAEELSIRLNADVQTRILVSDSAVKMRYDVAGGASSSIMSLVSKIWYNISIYLRGILSMTKDLTQDPYCIVILRSLYPKYCGFPFIQLYRRLLASSEGVVWDFDDDIFENREISISEAELLTSKADIITVTHTGLSELIPICYQEKVRCIPTTDGDIAEDLYHLNECRRSAYKKEIRLVWVASASSLAYLRHISPSLDMAASVISAKLNKRVTLNVVCNIPLEYKFKYLEMKFVKWGRDAALSEMRKAHIGIMPLDDTRFAKGKGGFKIVQYMAAGLPSVASAVGFNNDVVLNGETGVLASNSDEWIAGLLQLSGDYLYWESCSYAARHRWEVLYSYEKNVQLLASAIYEATHK